MSKKTQNKSNVISLSEKLETWQHGFTDSERQIEVKISNHGRMSIAFEGGQLACLSFVDSVSMLTVLNAKIEEIMGNSSKKR